MGKAVVLGNYIRNEGFDKLIEKMLGFPLMSQSFRKYLICKKQK